MSHNKGTSTKRFRKRRPLDSHTPVVVLERQRLVNGQVVGYEVRRFPRWIGDALMSETVMTQFEIALGFFEPTAAFS